MAITYNFCNNCGKTGHVFHNCKKPITSIGTIAYKINKDTGEIKYLLICRKDTLGFVDFMRGKYPLHDRKYIHNIVDEMTINEKQKLLDSNFDKLWRELWRDNIGIQYRGEERNSFEKFNSLKITTKQPHTIQSIISESTTTWTEPEWGFPKGRRNYKEKDITCALREFEEETGYSAKDMCLIQNLLPFEEVFTGSNKKSYKHCYYLAKMNDNTNNYGAFQETEVSAIDWFTYEEAIKKIRHYNLEKIEILTRVNKLLREYRIYT
jgi:8-oxo-dGTP pyrophosphatase MutT (NUDIX family)